MIAAAIIEGVSVAIAFSGGSSQAQPLADRTPESSSSFDTGVTEYADRSGGGQAQNRGTASDQDAVLSILVVEIPCVGPNDSSIRSIDAFYLISCRSWKGTHASVNQFSNRVPRETASGPSIDRWVQWRLAS